MSFEEAGSPLTTTAAGDNRLFFKSYKITVRSFDRTKTWMKQRGGGGRKSIFDTNSCKGNMVND